MRTKRSTWLAVLAAIVAGVGVLAFAAASTARADLVSDHQLAGLVGSGEVFVAGEPGYEEGMWHHVIPAELTAITGTGAGWFDVSWYVGDAGALPGTVHLDTGTQPVPPMSSDHQLAGLLATGQVYVTGEPGYPEGVWSPVTPTELASIVKSGAGLYDITWYGTLPGSVLAG